MIEKASQFMLEGEVLFCSPYGNGHINSSFVVFDSKARVYMLQKINKNVFINPPLLMENIVKVTEHLRKKANSHREVLSPILTKTGKYWIEDEENQYWRAYEFISDSICLEKIENLEDFKESGVAFGNFQRLLTDFDPSQLVETIPNFHDTANRYEIFKEAVKNDILGRTVYAQKEIDFALERENYASFLWNLHRKGVLPMRVTHNDTKLNNVLFDRFSRKALCVIDLDTVMPGFAANDFGDSIRFGATTAKEDEADLEKVNFNTELFEAFTEGFMSACGASLNDVEIETLRDGAKLMTLECGVRFLTDFLTGDNYFRINKEGQNLDRTRTQFKLVSDMEKYWDKMQKIVLKQNRS